MQTRKRHELFVNLVIIAVAALVFWQTSEFSGASDGQLTPGTFPRLAAGAMVVCAIIKVILLFALPDGSRSFKTLAWNRETLIKPVGAAVLMIAYVFLFGKMPFAALTGAFILSVFFVFGVRPWHRLVIGAMIATTFLYVLFARLLAIAI